MPEYSIKGEDGLTLCIVGPQNAIDRVEQLVKENERLRAALRAVDDEHGYGLPPETRKMIHTALKEDGDE